MPSRFDGDAGGRRTSHRPDQDRAAWQNREMRSVYICGAVSEVRNLQESVLDVYPSDWTVLEVLTRQVEVLEAAHARGDGAASIQPSQWLPRCLGQPHEAILSVPLDTADARLTVAREHGFPDWETVVTAGNVPLDPAFESAVDLALAGEVRRLGAQLRQMPALALARSAYGHRATLLHYLAANGVETWRQVVPANAADVVRLLIASGAEVNATMPVYGGHHTFLDLLHTSAHPADAGVTQAMAEVLSTTGESP